MAVVDAEIAHHVPGRFRLRHPRGIGNPTVLNTIKAAVDAVPGVESAETRPASGSVVVVYDPDHETDIADFLRGLGGTRPADRATTPPAARQRGGNGARPSSRGARPTPERMQAPPSNKVSEIEKEIEEEAEFLAEHSHSARVIVDFARDLDDRIKLATNNNLDLKIMVPVGLAAVTFLEIGAAAATPMWVTLMIFSLNHFVELHAHDDDNDAAIVTEPG